MLVGLLLFAGSSAAAPLSDTVQIVINGGTRAILTDKNFEGPERNGFTTAQVRVPGMVFDFMDADGLSDRLIMQPYNVTLLSDGNEKAVGPARAGATAVQESTFRRPLIITFTSDSNRVPEADEKESDVVSVFLNEKLNSKFTFFGAAEALGLAQNDTIPASKWDLKEADGTVSDYLDIDAISYSFVSDPVTFPEVPKGFVQTSIKESDGLTYEVLASSDAVPEPSTLALLGLGAMSLLGYRWRRRAA